MVTGAAKSLEASNVTEVKRYVRSMYTHMARISIEPLCAFYDFGAGQVPTLLKNLANGA